MREILDSGFEEKEKKWYSFINPFRLLLIIELPIFLFIAYLRVELYYENTYGFLSQINHWGYFYENGWTFVIIAIMILINVISLKYKPKPIYWSLKAACFLRYSNWVDMEPWYVEPLFLGLFFFYLLNPISKRFNIISIEEKVKYSYLLIVFVFTLSFLRNKIELIPS